ATPNMPRGVSLVVLALEFFQPQKHYRRFLFFNDTVVVRERGLVEPRAAPAPLRSRLYFCGQAAFNRALVSAARTLQMSSRAALGWAGQEAYPTWFSPGRGGRTTARTSIPRRGRSPAAGTRTDCV